MAQPPAREIVGQSQAAYPFNGVLDPGCRTWLRCYAVIDINLLITYSIMYMHSRKAKPGKNNGKKSVRITFQSL
jgi:hypothetical protein